MNNDIKLAIIILLGIVLTFTAMIVGSIYNNNQNIGRDKFYASHCTKVHSELKSPDLNNSQEYTCGATK